MRTRRMLTISRHDQLAMLVSPVRQELLDVLARMGPASLTEIGAALGRPADGLYYHVRALQRVGLVNPAGVRIRAGRREALFRAAASQFAVRYAAAPSRQARAVSAIVAAMLRLGIRDYRRALADGGARLAGPERDLWALRTMGWLRPSHVRQVNRLIRALATSAAQPGPAGRPYAVTVLLTPLVQRNSRTGRRLPRRTTP